jgi:hypothetical protein
VLLAEGAVGDLADDFRHEFVSTHSLIQKAAFKRFPGLRPVRGHRLRAEGALLRQVLDEGDPGTTTLW